MTEKLYTEAELRAFDIITEKMSSRNQLDRIKGRMEIKKFLEQHGKEKCDAMFAVLQKRDKRA